MERQANNAEQPSKNPIGQSLVARRATGPRTPQGKQRCKSNAIQHGIFSKVVVLKSEPQADFDALLGGLRKDLQPVGTLEEILVEKLAALLWRSRRLYMAEAAEIRRRAEFVEWDGKERDREQAAGLPQFSCNRGLIRWIANPVALRACLDLLGELKDGIEVRGFEPKLDTTVLTKLYGDYDEENYYQPLFHSYLLWSRAASFSAEECEQRGLPSPEQSKEGFLGEVKEAIKQLRNYEKEHEKIVSSKLGLESLRHTVPDTPVLDRLLRYETTLERATDRLLNQLERLQRMRLGKPVLPPINLNLTAS